jgi:hypothetical protein
MEMIAYELKKLPEDGRRELAAVSLELADEARAAGRAGAADFYESAPDAIGLLEAAD